jgi:hypothetical protein
MALFCAAEHGPATGSFCHLRGGARPCNRLILPMGSFCAAGVTYRKAFERRSEQAIRFAPDGRAPDYDQPNRAARCLTENSDFGFRISATVRAVANKQEQKRKTRFSIVNIVNIVTALRGKDLRRRVPNGYRHAYRHTELSSVFTAAS